MMFHRGSPDHRPLSELEILRRRVKELEAAAQKHQDVETLQRSLHECQEKLKSTFDASPDAIIITDLDGDITECNKAMVSILGLNTKEAVIGRHFSTLVVPSDRPHARQKFLEVIQNGTSREVEVSLDVAGNRQIPVLTAGSLIFDSKGVPASVIICAKDISQRKALEEENIRLATAIEQADEMVLVADHQGAICYANPAFEKVTGYTRNEVLGKNLCFLESADHNQDSCKAMWTLLQDGKTWKGHFTTQKKDGSVYVEEATISPVRGRDGRISHLVAVKRDVSEIINLETQLRQSQKMEAIGTLAWIFTQVIELRKPPLISG